LRIRSLGFAILVLVVTSVAAIGQVATSSFAADATHVYWTTHTPSATTGAPDDCAIVSLAK
jgi:hypothetical protein